MWLLKAGASSLLKLSICCMACGFLTACNGSKNLEFQQVFSGLNGPVGPQSGPRKGQNGSFHEIYENAADVERSWLTVTLTQAEFVHLLSQVDFKEQFLYVYSVGNSTGPSMDGLERKLREVDANAIGANGLKFTRMRLRVDEQYAAIESTVNLERASFDNAPTGCEYPKGENYPFAIAVVQRPPKNLILADAGSTLYSVLGECLKPKSDSK